MLRALGKAFSLLTTAGTPSNRDRLVNIAITSLFTTPDAVKSSKLRARGKVRDIYDLGDRLLIVATDRLSAFDRSSA